MGINRRGFFKTMAGLAAGGAAAAVAGPSLRLQNEPKPAVSNIQTVVNKGLASPITFRHLEEAYQNCTRGSVEPDVIWVSRAAYERIKGQMAVQQRFIAYDATPAGPVSGLLFNHAVLAPGPALQDDEILVSNRKIALSRRFRALPNGDLWPVWAVEFIHPGGAYSQGSDFHTHKIEWVGWKKA